MDSLQKHNESLARQIESADSANYELQRKLHEKERGAPAPQTAFASTPSYSASVPGTSIATVAAPLVNLFAVPPEKLQSMSREQLVEHVKEIQGFCLRDSLATSQVQSPQCRCQLL